MALPQTQYAVQLVGPDQLRLNVAKPVAAPGRRQLVAQVEAVGLCFSDLKLLHQFAAHVRKSEVTTVLSAAELAEIPSYVPGDLPTVPGHEAVCTIAAVGADVRHHAVGERVLVQADFRELKTAGANAAFGYNFEGALQEYVLLDERVVIEPSTQQRYLVPVEPGLSASAVCLAEPWACVEASYVNEERGSILAGGRLLVVVEDGHAVEGLVEGFAPEGPPGAITFVCRNGAESQALARAGLASRPARRIEELEKESFDDIVYFGAKKATIDALNDLLGQRGIINLVLGGEKIGRDVSVGVGRIHYGLTRWVGTTGRRAVDGYRMIPPTGELREGDTITVVGAGGPMGQMHVIRSLCADKAGLRVTAADIDDGRLGALAAKARPLAESRGVPLRLVNTQKEAPAETSSYFALMAPVGALVAEAVAHSAESCRVNIFAGIPAGHRQDLDMDRCISKGCFVFGTSGSTIRDMKLVLAKVSGGQLDTNWSVDAIAGMAGAVDGIRAVKDRTLAGKIIVYPALHDMGLIALSQLHGPLPTVAARLDRGRWCKAAEDELLRITAAGARRS